MNHILLYLIGCQSDQALKEIRFENIAVVSGDFDHMGETLICLDIGFSEFEGIIEQPVFDTNSEAELNILKVEALFRDIDENNSPKMLEYDAIFVNSGVRGLGKYVYNGVEADDDLVNDPTVINHVKEYVDLGRTLIVSDWSGDLIEAVWPDKIQFLNENTCDEAPCWDAAQVGVELIEGYANITDADLKKDLGTDSLSIDFDYSYWTVMGAVSSDVDVYLRGDIEYRVSGEEGYATLTDVPLLVGFNSGSGRVIFSSFHWRIQNPAVASQLMLYVAQGLEPGPEANLPEQSSPEESNDE